MASRQTIVRYALTTAIGAWAVLITARSCDTARAPEPQEEVATTGSGGRRSTSASTIGGGPIAGGGGNGLTQVHHDANFTGTGTSTSPLTTATSFTLTDTRVNHSLSVGDNASGTGLTIDAYTGTLTKPHVRVLDGDPNSIVPGEKGSILLDTSTPAIWQNTTGAMIWTVLGSVSPGSISRAELTNGDPTSVIGRSAGTSGPEADIDATVDGQVLQRASGVLTFAALAASSITGLAAIATSGSATDLVTGTLPSGRFPALAGDVTTSAGSITTVIGAHKVTRAMQTQGNATSVIGVSGGSTADVADVSANADGQVLQRASGALVWATIAAASLPAFAGGDVTSSAGSVVLSIGAHKVTRGMEAQGAGTSVIGVTGGSTADVADIVASADGQVLYRTGGTLGFSDLSSVVPTLGIFGDGSDGSLHFDGSTPVLGVTPSGSVYTLTREINATSILIDNGVTVVPAATDTQVTGTQGTQAFRIFCTGTLTNNGTIRNNGSAGAVTGASNTGKGAAPSFGTVANGNNGGGGGTTAAGTGGTNNSVYWTTGTGGTGGTGTGGNGTGTGAGGAGGGRVGGAGGAGGNLAVVTAAQGSVRNFFAAYSGVLVGAGNTQWHFGGAGGGGGCSDGTVVGGGGGGGGGVVGIFARTLAGSGTIEAKGGGGGKPTGGGGGTTTGGGGGGGGGTIILVHTTGTMSTSVTAGAGNTGGSTGTSGGNGADGGVFDFKL
jgi:hypothetical protein